MSQWNEFRLWYGTGASPDSLFEFKKAGLIPLLDKHGVDDFLNKREIRDKRPSVYMRAFSKKNNQL